MSAISAISPADSSRTQARYAVWDGIIPLPPDSLIWSVGGSSLELFLVVADAWAQAIARYMQPDTTVLDIGCGCGRTARTLLPHPYLARYIGFDVVPENVAWCKRYLEPFGKGRATFLHYDMYSAEYNPKGSMQPSSLVFPCADGSVDLIIAASLFTHLLEPDAVHYIQEIGRVISARGHAMLSIHTNVPEGQRFIGTETRIDIASAYFIELGAAAGLKLVRELNDLCGQRVCIFGRN
jgi:SAM-dependent methyltransferase